MECSIRNMCDWARRVSGAWPFQLARRAKKRTLSGWPAKSRLDHQEFADVFLRYQPNELPIARHWHGATVARLKTCQYLLEHLGRISHLEFALHHLLDR